MHVLQTQDYFRSIELHFVFIEHTMLQIKKINKCISIKVFFCDPDMDVVR